MFIILLKYILLIVLLQLSHFSPLYSPMPYTPPHSTSSFPHLSSCPWVIHVGSLASPYPILVLTSPCLVSIYHLCFLFPVPFLPFSHIPLPTDNPPCELHFCESVPVLVLCLVCFCFQSLVVDSCETVVISLFIVLIFFFLDKSLKHFIS